MVGIGTTSSEVDGGRPFWPRPFWPPRNWWLALLVILVLAGALRFPGYGFSLPHVVHLGGRADEAFYILAARMNLDMGTAKSMDAHHYPPGILTLNYVTLRLFQDSNSPPTVVIGGLRLLAISVSLATIAILALLGYHLDRAPAGLISAALWAVMPTMVEFSRYATADIYVTFFTILAFWLTLTGTLHERYGWTTAGTYALMLAIVFKYQAATIAPFLLFAPLINGRRAWRNVLGNLGRFALFFAWLLLLTPVLDAFIKPEDAIVPNSWIRRLDIDSASGVGQFSAGIQSVLAELDLRPLLPGWLGLLLLTRERFGKKHLALSLIVLSALAWNFGLSLFEEHDIRFLIAPVSMAILFAGLGYALLWQAAAPWLARFSVNYRWLPATAALMALALLNLPNLQASVADLRDKMRPDQRNDLAVWADGSLPASKYITNYSNHRTLNSSWGGYAGETRFGYAGPLYSNTTSDEWRAQDLLFAIASYGQYDLWREGGADEFATQTTLLKSYPPSDAYRGPAMVVLVLHSIQHQATGKLGPIRLIGYDLPSRTASAGQSHPLPSLLAGRSRHRDRTTRSSTTCSMPRVTSSRKSMGHPCRIHCCAVAPWIGMTRKKSSIVANTRLALPEDLPPGEYYYRHRLLPARQRAAPAHADRRRFTLGHHHKRRRMSGAGDGRNRHSKQPAGWRTAILAAAFLAAAQLVAGAAGDSGAGRRVALPGLWFQPSVY